MSRSSLTAAVAGTLAGALAGLLALAMAAGQVMHGGMAAASDGAATFAVTQAGLYLYVVVLGAIAGALLALLGYAIGHQKDPHEERYGLGPIAALGAGAGAVLGFAVSRAAVGLAGDIVANTVLLTPFRAGFVALATGATTGFLVAIAGDRLSLQSIYGFSGEALPRSFGDFVRDAMAAIGLPVLGLAAAVGLVFGLSRVFLEAEGTVALIAFGGVAALILFGAAAIAARPPRRR